MAACRKPWLSCCRAAYRAQMTDDVTPEPDDHGRVAPPVDADEATTLLAFLDYHRATLAWKTAGLDSADLNAPMHPTTMTLGGLLKHLAGVEVWWFSEVLAGRPEQLPWSAADWEADADWDWHSAADDEPADLRGLWQAAVDDSRRLTADALAVQGLDTPARWSFPEGGTPTLRWILVHMIEEYARHNGHADLLREAVDGLTGE